MTTNVKRRRDKEPLDTARLRYHKLVEPPWKLVGQFPKREIGLSYNLAILPQGIYPKECTPTPHKDAYTFMFASVLCTVARIDTQPI